MVGGGSIDPWSSEQSTDYDRMIEQFGLSPMDLGSLPNPGMLHRRGIVFAHRDMDVITDSISNQEPFGVLTGLMPSGRMHLGHSMVIEQVRWFQEQGADVTVAVADLEALATRGTSLSEGRKTALREYVSNYAALGLDPNKTNVYFQSSRPEVQRLAFTLGKRTNLSELDAIYGFGGDTNLAHVQAPLVQVGDIVHPQLDDFGGLRPIVVPVGVDQDPHLRLTRDITQKTNWFNVKKRKSGGLTVALSVQEENQTEMGVSNSGRIDMESRAKLVGNIVDCISELGFSDIKPNPKHGTIEIPGATIGDRSKIRIKLLQIERNLGGLGLLPPCSTYHRFAVGMTGDKMSSSKPESTIFMDDDVESMEKKVKRAISGGQPTVEEHRRLGGDVSKDVAYQYLQFFFEDDDAALDEIKSDYESGRMLAGDVKKVCIDRATEWLNDLKEKRNQMENSVADFLAVDAI
ncbi:MAG: tryptophan--tRNA ligase [Euryarchaeota archaeon]|jgi:tryptophanyl-tRNA synthetase|nr:tryptophan--tRNA ligase [Euryarchaeota archaeon]|tara:strand:+ start:141 stop:1523 length:1383 start_codon:yes stop_codon:yes gene_type:complete